MSTNPSRRGPRKFQSPAARPLLPGRKRLRFEPLEERQLLASGGVIVDGGDRDDHGFAQAGPDTMLGTSDDVNIDGWKFIEQMVDYAASGQQNNAPNDILAIGTSSTALAAINSAAVVLGLNVTVATGATIGTVDFTQFKVMYIPSGGGNTSGGVSDTDLALLTARVLDVQNFVNTGGSLVALTQQGAATPYSWLALPDLFTIDDPSTDQQYQTQALIDAGLVITNAELINGTPLHNTFTGPAGFNGLQPFVFNFGSDGTAQTSDDEIVTLGLAPGSTGIGSTGLIVTGADAGGGPHVRVFNLDGSERFGFLAYDPNFTGGVRVATGDINGDGTFDIITAPGFGGGPHIRVFDGVTGAQLPGPIGSFMAFLPEATQVGAYVASGDFNFDGFDDIVIGALTSASQNPTGSTQNSPAPYVRIISGATGLELGNIATKGVRVAVGDVNGDEFLDLICSQGDPPGTVPAVEVYNGLTGQLFPNELGFFFAYDPLFRGGVYSAVGDVNNDGFDDIITGAGAGGGPHVKVFSGLDNALLASFFAYNAAFTGGVRVGSADLNGDGFDDIITGAGPGGGPHARAFSGQDLSDLSSFLAYSPAFQGGIFVAGANQTSGGGGTFTPGGGGHVHALLGPTAPSAAAQAAELIAAGDASALAALVAKAETDLAAVLVGAKQIAASALVSALGCTLTNLDDETLDGLLGAWLDGPAAAALESLGLDLS